MSDSYEVRQEEAMMDEVSQRSAPITTVVEEPPKPVGATAALSVWETEADPPGPPVTFADHLALETKRMAQMKEVDGSTCPPISPRPPTPSPPRTPPRPPSPPPPRPPSRSACPPIGPRPPTPIPPRTPSPPPSPPPPRPPSRTARSPSSRSRLLGASVSASGHFRWRRCFRRCCCGCPIL